MICNIMLTKTQTNVVATVGPKYSVITIMCCKFMTVLKALKEQAMHLTFYKYI